MDDPAHHIVHIEHTAWAALERGFAARLRAGDADEDLGRILLAQLVEDRPVEMRDPAQVPPSRMFHALSWLVQQGWSLEVRERLEQTEFERRTGHVTRRRQWRLAATQAGPSPTQPALF